MLSHYVQRELGLLSTCLSQISSLGPAVPFVLLPATHAIPLGFPSAAASEASSSCL
jgi:hypothetical protein